RPLTRRSPTGLGRCGIAYDATPRTLRRVVARAKQTARAEARRRNRLASRPVGAEPDLDAADGDDADTATPTAERATRAVSRPADGGSVLQRLSGSFRGAYHRPNIREDLRQWRSIVISPAFLGGIGLILAGGIAYLLYPGYSGTTLAFQY